MKRRTRIGVGVVFFMVSTLLSRGRRNCQPFVAARYALKVTALSPCGESITSRRDRRYEAPKGFSSEYFGAQQRLIFTHATSDYENEIFYGCAGGDALCRAFADVFFCTSRDIDCDRTTPDTDICA